MLIPLPVGLFRDYDLVTRAVVGALYDRLKLSSYHVTGGEDGEKWVDPIEQRVFCVFSHAELAEQIGVGERTVRRSLKQLNDDGLVWWRKAAYKSANRYFLHDAIMDALRKQ